MSDAVKSDDVSRLLFDVYALIEHVRSAAPAPGVDADVWRESVRGKAQHMWDDLVGAFYKADPEAFREAITAIIDAASPVSQRLQDPRLSLPDRAALTEEIMREYQRSVLPHTDEHGVLRPEVAVRLDQALKQLRAQGRDIRELGA